MLSKGVILKLLLPFGIINLYIYTCWYDVYYNHGIYIINTVDQTVCTTDPVLSEILAVRAHTATLRHSSQRRSRG